MSLSSSSAAASSSSSSGVDLDLWFRSGLLLSVGLSGYLFAVFWDVLVYVVPLCFLAGILLRLGVFALFHVLWKRVLRPLLCLVVHGFAAVLTTLSSKVLHNPESDEYQLVSPKSKPPSDDEDDEDDAAHKKATAKNQVIEKDADEDFGRGLVEEFEQDRDDHVKEKEDTATLESRALRGRERSRRASTARKASRQTATATSTARHSVITRQASRRRSSASSDDRKRDNKDDDDDDDDLHED